MTKFAIFTKITIFSFGKRKKIWPAQSFPMHQLHKAFQFCRFRSCKEETGPVLNRYCFRKFLLLDFLLLQVLKQTYKKALWFNNRKNFKHKYLTFSLQETWQEWKAPLLQQNSRKRIICTPCKVGIHVMPCSVNKVRQWFKPKPLFKGKFCPISQILVLAAVVTC